MGCERQLKWIQENRGRRKRTRQVGTLINDLAQHVEARDALGKNARAIADFVDDEFRDHCRVAGFRAGALLIHVDHASLVYPMRLRWLARLVRALPRLAEGRRVSEIVFAFGNDGARIPRPGQRRD